MGVDYQNAKQFIKSALRQSCCKEMDFKVVALLGTLLCTLQLTLCAPSPQSQSDMDSYAGGNAVDYNSIASHFKDFFMYFPVMMTTLKETMTGFPKFAEGIRILVSKNGRLNDDDCNCKLNSNEI